MHVELLSFDEVMHKCVISDLLYALEIAVIRIDDSYVPGLQLEAI